MDHTIHNRCGVSQHQVSNALGHQFTLHVSLPATYHQSEKRYPVLYVLDSYIGFGIASDMAKQFPFLAVTASPSSAALPKMASEMIVVGIGYPGENAVSMAQDMAMRRNFDFTSVANPTGEGERIWAAAKNKYPQTQGISLGGATEFYAMLKDVVIPLVDRTYQTTSDRVLYGASCGGLFAALALLMADSPFTHYIIASPALYLSGEDVFEREAAYAANHKDLNAKVYISFGTQEWEEYALTGIAASTTRFAEKLTLRGYPNLRIRTHIISDANHVEACAAAMIFGLSTITGWGL